MSYKVISRILDSSSNIDCQSLAKVLFEARDLFFSTLPSTCPPDVVDYFNERYATFEVDLYRASVGAWRSNSIKISLRRDFILLTATVSPRYRRATSLDELANALTEACYSSDDKPFSPQYTHLCLFFGNDFPTNISSSNLWSSSLQLDKQAVLNVARKAKDVERLR